MSVKQPFSLETNFAPRGDQPKAIDKLVRGVKETKKAQVLLGVTGSGKTFTMANVIAQVQKPALILAHNKTLAAQLYQEFKSFFPNNAVEYFVSYYDYYQPEAYLPRTDTYIEKDMSINQKIDKMRLSATRSLLERDDVIIVASVSCIYGLGSPEYYQQMNLVLEVGNIKPREELILHLVDMQYKRNDVDFERSTFRIRGDCVDVFPAYEEDLAIRLEFFGDELETISEIDPLTGKTKRFLSTMTLYPSSHHVTPEEIRWRALETIQKELEERKAYYETENRWLELERIQQRTSHDIAMIREVGTCKGIENYSRHLDLRAPGQPPLCLLDYFRSEYLLFIDESHQTLPQIKAMFNGDRARKQALVEFGFRLPSAYDNRPLRFEEFYSRIYKKNATGIFYISATPGEWEIKEAEGEIIEQVIRPTGLLDPLIEIRPASKQIDDCLGEIRTETLKGGRTLVTTLTKRLAEELTSYLNDLGVKAKYLHSDIDTLERIEIINDLRLGTFDVLVGINLLREGLDIPEVTLIAILDADKEGFLRSKTSLIQTCGRAARNDKGRVLMYADTLTRSITDTVNITDKRRALQDAYNKLHGITPKTVRRDIIPLLEEEPPLTDAQAIQESISEHLTLEEVQQKVKECEKEMKKAAKELRFEEATEWRNKMQHFQQILIAAS